MNSINLRNVDLNLLTIFLAIYEEQGISRAAQRLGMTQPAVSHALSRLRSLFDDDLFERTRGPGGARMTPTAKAHSVAEPLAGILADVGEVLTGSRPFDPRTAERALRVGMLEYGMTVHAPAIAEMLAEEAPNVHLDCRNIQIDTALERLDLGELDIAIGPFDGVPARFDHEVVMGGRFVVAASRENPRLRKRVVMQEFTELPHVDISNLSGLGRLIDGELQRLGHSRHIVMTVPHYSAALFAVTNGELITTVPEGPAEIFQEICGLALFEPPISIAPMRVSAVRHRRHAGDPFMDWAWDRLLEGAAKGRSVLSGTSSWRRQRLAS